MTWWQDPLIGFDLETTSSEPEEARIVTAAVTVCSAQGIERHTWLVDPGVEIPDEAAEIHGITTEVAVAQGRPAAEAVPEILEALMAQPLAFARAAFNTPYDNTVLDRELRRLGLDGPALRLRELLWVDPHVMDKWLDRYRPKAVASHNLEDTCRVWDATIDGPHDAAFDAVATCRLAWRLGSQGKVRRNRPGEAAELQAEWDSVRESLGMLQSWQAQKYRTEAKRFAEYIRKGDPKKDVPPQPERADGVMFDWPLVPVPATASLFGEGS